MGRYIDLSIFIVLTATTNLCSETLEYYCYKSKKNTGWVIKEILRKHKQRATVPWQYSLQMQNLFCHCLFNPSPSLTFRVIKTLSLNYILTYTLTINMLLPYICSQSNFAILDFSALVVAKTVTVSQAQVCVQSH